MYRVDEQTTLGPVGTGACRTVSFLSLFFICYFDFFKTESHYIALGVLEFTMRTRLASNSQRSACLCLPSAGIKDMPPMSHRAVFLLSFLAGMKDRIIVKYSFLAFFLGGC